jgi:hypothetical protein
MRWREIISFLAVVWSILILLSCENTNHDRRKDWFKEIHRIGDSG